MIDAVTAMKHAKTFNMYPSTSLGRCPDCGTLAESTGYCEACGKVTVKRKYPQYNRRQYESE